MRIYEIINGEEKMSVGCLLYFEKENSWIIELQDYLDEWTAPLLFANTVKKGVFTINREMSSIWVKGRIIPGDRQNLDSILADAGMKRYDEMMLLDRTGGKCSQDSLYIKGLDAIPEYVGRRMAHNLMECVPCDDYSLLCFFADGMVRKLDLLKLKGFSEIRKIVSNEEIFKSAHIAAGGYCVTFNDSLDIYAKELLKVGTKIPLSLNDFLSFVQLNVLDSSECCDILNCSRQNLTNYLSKKQLIPIKKNVKGNLYTKGNVYRSDARIIH